MSTAAARRRRDRAARAQPAGRAPGGDRALRPRPRQRAGRRARRRSTPPAAALGHALAGPLREPTRTWLRRRSDDVGGGARLRRPRDERRAAPRHERRPHAKRASAGSAPTSRRRFLEALAEHAGLVLHVRLLNGTDSGHVLEAIFKALGAALAAGVRDRQEDTHERQDASSAPRRTGAVPGSAVLAGDRGRRLRLRLRPARAGARRHRDLGRDRGADRAGLREPAARSSRRQAPGSTGSSKTTVFLQNLDDFQAMNGVYAKHVGDQPPARSTVEVAKLPSGALVEIEAVALL